jgi:hypothetical protein
MIIMLLNFIQVRPTYTRAHHSIVDITASTYQAVRDIVEKCDTFSDCTELLTEHFVCVTFIKWTHCCEVIPIFYFILIFIRYN